MTEREKGGVDRLSREGEEAQSPLPTEKANRGKRAAKFRRARGP